MSLEKAVGEHARILKEQSKGRQMVIVPYFEREEMEHEELQWRCAGNAKKRR